MESEKAKIAALVGESSVSLPEVSTSEKGKDGGPAKPEFKSSVVQPKPFENPDKTPPPRSFQMCVEQAYLSAKAAIDAGYKLIEVEFPPLPQTAIDNGAIGAYTILDANVQVPPQLSAPACSFDTRRSLWENSLAPPHCHPQHARTAPPNPRTVKPEPCCVGSAQHARGFARFFEGKNVAIVFSDAEERNMFVDDETYGMLTPRRPGAVRYSALGGGWKGRSLSLPPSLFLSFSLSLLSLSLPSLPPPPSLSLSVWQVPSVFHCFYLCSCVYSPVCVASQLAGPDQSSGGAGLLERRVRGRESVRVREEGRERQ